MSETRRLLRRTSAFISRRSHDAELDSELEAHLEMATDAYLEQNMTPAEARRRALIDIGGIQQAREKHREARGLMHIDILMHDLRYALRKLKHEPGFTLIAVLILALAIGANIAVFSVVNTIMLRPLPFPNAQQLVWIAPPPAKCGLSCATYSTDAYDEFRVGSRSYQDVTGYFAFSSPGNLKLTVNAGSPVPATSIDVIANFFDVLGVHPAMGRLFRPEDGRNGAAPVIVLSDAWWRRQFNADPNIVGKAFDINGQQTTVIGVLPKTFDFGAVFSPGAKIDALTPLNLYGPPRDWGNIITMIGRLKPAVSLPQAIQEAAAVAPSMCWNNKQPQSCGSYKGYVIPVRLKDYVTGRLHRSLVVLWSAVAMILLIACVNLSNLLLARAAARSKEFAMRGALGASRLRIVRQLLTESLVLSLGGAVFGLGLAFLLISWITRQVAIALPLLSQVQIDGAALGWTLLIAISSAMLFGLIPSLRMSAGNLSDALKDSGAGSGQGRKQERLRSVLVISEVALACVLLVGAGLLLRSFLRVLDVDLGFQPEHAAAVNIDYSDNPADGDGSTPNSSKAILARRQVFNQQVLDRVTAIPGIKTAGISDFLPLGQNRSWGLPFPKGVRPPDKPPSGPLVYVVSPGYLGALGTSIRGRDFTWSDRSDSQPVVIINESYARYLASFANWPNGDAVGQIITDGVDKRVIAVSQDVHTESVEGENGWQIYYPSAQTFAAAPRLVIRTTLPPATLASSVMSALREINPKQTAAEFVPLQNFVDHANSPRRFFMLLVISFASLGLLLAALGIYGVISYSVTRQTHEIGVRMALGASASHVCNRILKSTLRLAMIGVIAGAVVSIAAAQLVAALLYATSPWDSMTYYSTAAILLGVALFAGYLPAMRASRISPLIALRAE